MSETTAVESASVAGECHSVVRPAASRAIPAGLFAADLGRSSVLLKLMIRNDVQNHGSAVGLLRLVPPVLLCIWVESPYLDASRIRVRRPSPRFEKTLPCDCSKNAS